jgi:hypothetical protein
MSRRGGSDEILFSLDSFLDIVTNVVGVLVLVAMVTVVSAGNISVPSGATAMTAPQPSAERVLFECAGDEVFFVDEEGNGQRVLSEVRLAGDDWTKVWAPTDTPRARPNPRAALAALLAARDVGDATHRVQADALDRGVAWVYTLRPEAHGDYAADLDRADSAFQKRLAGLERGGFAYFVVHDDSFEVFRKARDIARARGVSIGWHPVEGRAPLRISAIGSLGKRIQ